MKNAIEWFKEKGFGFDDKITIADVIALQEDARKDGLMTAQMLASDVINADSHFYKDRGPVTCDIPDQVLSGLNYKVCSRILAEADKLKYLPK